MSNIGKLGSVLNGSAIPKTNGLIPAYGGNGIISFVDNKNYSGETIVIGRVGANCGNIQYVDGDCWITDNALAMKVNDEYDAKYVYYLLKQLNLNNFHIGSSQPLLTQGIINKIDFDYTEDKKTQEKIATVLYLLDTKIENNNKVNSELESLAKTIYDYWFLQFEFPNEEGKPYKSSGGKMVWNDELKREIPEGWEVKELGGLLDKKNRPHNHNNNVNTIDLSVMPSNSISLNQLNESKNFETNLFGMKKGDLLFGSIRPYLRKAGIAPCDGAVAGTVHCYEVKNNDNYNLCMAILCSENLFNYAINISKGTKMPVVSSDDLLSFKTPYDKETTKKFSSLNIKDIICKNVMENQELASLRDFLLPMLMNGQVTFKDENY